jgi:hypothetical protein
MPVVRTRPCNTCPYRCDVPSGVWAADEYERLRPYDNETWGQPLRAFFCHTTPKEYCHWLVVVHINRGHEYDLLALRLHPPDGPIPGPVVELFASANEAADHGLTEIDWPSDEASLAIERLVRKPWIRDE